MGGGDKVNKILVILKNVDFEIKVVWIIISRKILFIGDNEYNSFDIFPTLPTFKVNPSEGHCFPFMVRQNP